MGEMNVKWLFCRSKCLVDRRRNALRRATVLQHDDKLAVRGNDVSHRRVIDGIVAFRPLWLLAVAGSVHAGDGSNLLRRPGNADQAGVKEGDVFRQALQRIALRIDRDDNPLHLLQCGGIQPGKPLRDQRQRHRANVRAVDVAQIQHHHLATKIHQGNDTLAAGGRAGQRQGLAWLRYRLVTRFPEEQHPDDHAGEQENCRREESVSVHSFLFTACFSSSSCWALL